MHDKPIHFDLEPLPENPNQALEWLMKLVAASDNQNLREVFLNDFKNGWYSIGFLYPGLNPDSAVDHGNEVSDETGDDSKLMGWTNA